MASASFHVVVVTAFGPGHTLGGLFGGLGDLLDGGGLGLTHHVAIGVEGVHRLEVGDETLALFGVGQSFAGGLASAFAGTFDLDGFDIDEFLVGLIVVGEVVSWKDKRLIRT